MRTAVIRECFVIFLQFLNLSINNFDFDYVYDFFFFSYFQHLMLRAIILMS